MNRIRKYRALTPEDRRILNQAFLALVIAGASLRLLPLRRMVHGLPPEVSPSSCTPAGHENRTVERIGWAVRVAAGQIPWTVSCLPQAIAAKRLLRREGIVSKLFFGVDRGEKGDLEAHAWLMTEDIDVVGGEARDRYTVVASFS